MNAPITRMREKRRDMLLILVTAVFFALAVNFLTSYVSVTAKNNPHWLLLSGLLFLVGGILLLSKVVFSTQTEVHRFRGAVAFKTVNDSVEPVEIIGYSFNDDFCEYLRGFIQENKA